MVIFSYYKNKKVILKKNFQEKRKISQAFSLSFLLIFFLFFSLFFGYIFLASKKSSLEIEIETSQKKLRELKEEQRELEIKLGKLLSLSNLREFAQKNNFEFESEENPVYFHLAEKIR